MSLLNKIAANKEFEVIQQTEQDLIFSTQGLHSAVIKLEDESHVFYRAYKQSNDFEDKYIFMPGFKLGKTERSLKNFVAKTCEVAKACA